MYKMKTAKDLLITSVLLNYLCFFLKINFKRAYDESNIQVRFYSEMDEVSIRYKSDVYEVHLNVKVRKMNMHK